MHQPLCEGELDIQARLTPPPPRASLSPKAQAGPQGLGGCRRRVGESWKAHHTQPPHGASLSPKRPRQNRRDSGVSAAV